MKIKSSVLLIDDTPDILTLYRIILESDGFTVYTAQSGTQALAILDEIDRPNLIILDIKMKDMSGVEFLELLQKSRPEILREVPAVFLSGMPEAPVSMAVGMIRKGCDLSSFLEQVHHLIESDLATLKLKNQQRGNNH